VRTICAALACLFAYAAFTPIAHPGITYTTPTTITEQP
jgi:hypothetical protein